MRRGIKKERHDFCRVFLFGGDEEDRTLDLTDANRTLSQLSYAPICRRYFNGKKYYTIKFLIVKSDFFWKTKIFSCQSHKDIVK